MTLKILFADNDPLFVETCTEFLELHGYHVLKAYTPEDAGRLLDEGAAHLAILDLRMRNDRDKFDLSGLTLAKNSNPAIPKIILTSFQSWETVREALSPADDNVTPAVSFLAKSEGLEALLRHTERAFEKFVPFNQQLDIEWKARDCVSLLRLIEPWLKHEQLGPRAEELEDLFRLLFRRQQKLRIERLVWHEGGRVALTCFAFETGKKPEALLVVCGPKELLTEEARRFREYAPASGGPGSTLLYDEKATTHFAANVYVLSGTQLEDLHPLEALYRDGAEKPFKAALKNLFTETLGAWAEGRVVPVDKAELGRIYRRRLGLPRQRSLRAVLAEHAEALSESLPSVGVEVLSEDGTLTFRFGGNEHAYTLPPRLTDAPFAHIDLTHMQHTPGELSAASVLVDAQQRVWVTDFAAAGLAPAPWAFAEVEAAVRFDLVNGARPAWLHEMERRLVFGSFLKLRPDDVEPPLRKPLKAIGSIRQLARLADERKVEVYQLGLLLQAGKRLAALRPSATLLGPELVRAAHLLMTTTMLCDRIERGTGATSVRRKGVWLNPATSEVWIDGQKLSMRGHGYDLLRYFYEHPNKLCTRRELVERVFSEEYVETDVTQTARLNTAIHRLRKQIEEDPENPRYLLTEQRGGYRFAMPSSEPQ